MPCRDLNYAARRPADLASEPFLTEAEQTDLDQRIAAGVIAEGDCRIWIRGRKSRHEGYGVIKFRGRAWRVHRLVMALMLGRWPVGVIRHRCNDDRCVCPAHLIEGTSSENNHDTWDSGHRSPGQPLSAEECQLIDDYHQNFESTWTIAEVMCLPRSTVFDYLKRTQSPDSRPPTTD